MFMKLSILYNMFIFSVNADNDMLGFGLLPQKTVFDPSTFTDNILQCHIKCGDDYHTCSFVKCDPNLILDVESFHYEKKRMLEQDMDGDSVSQQICLDKCTSIFRLCYKRCICDANPMDAKCMQVINVYPQTFAPLQKYKQNGATSNEENESKASYLFDWSKFP